MKFLLTIATLFTLTFLAACGTIIQNDSTQDESLAEFTPLNYVSLSRMEHLISIAHELEEVVYVYISADYPVYSSLEDLTLLAMDIVRVEVLDERVEVINVLLPSPYNYEGQTSYDILTIHRLRVLEVFKGDTKPGDIIEIMQEGGKYGNVHVIHPYRILFAEGDDVVLFLANRAIDFDIHIPSVLLSPFQAAYNFTPSSTDARLRNASDELESIFPYNDLILTLNDLARISESNLDE
ncbi:MAG: hypothetical protein FWC91_14800 [Defluviitaleaceae bacterium]|nr:hypothetical protein [Defluviitaleaceae bacterium]